MLELQVGNLNASRCIDCSCQKFGAVRTGHSQGQNRLGRRRNTRCASSQAWADPITNAADMGKRIVSEEWSLWSIAVRREYVRRLWRDLFLRSIIANYAKLILALPFDGLRPFKEISSIGFQGASGFLVSNGTR